VLFCSTQLEEELENITRPSLLISSLTAPTSGPPTATPTPVEGLEAELACCGCLILCAPPIKIYQVSHFLCVDGFDWPRVSVLSPHWRIFLLLFLEMALNLIGPYFV
jgi:hypothetical protein